MREERVRECLPPLGPTSQMKEFRRSACLQGSGQAHWRGQSSPSLVKEDRGLTSSKLLRMFLTLSIPKPRSIRLLATEGFFTLHNSRGLYYIDYAVNGAQERYRVVLITTLQQLTSSF